tara:strand:+ start:54 stop:533 length:480 start_codon:yes stop_codon:yes gene_type:complete
MATLKVKIQEDIVLNNNNYSSKRIYTKAGVNEAIKRIITVSTTETGLIGFATANSTDLSKSHSVGLFDEDEVFYIRITNLDDTNHINLIFRDELSDEFVIKVDAGHSFIYPGDATTGVVNTMRADDGALGAFGSPQDLIDITATADTASCDVEVFVGSS